MKRVKRVPKKVYDTTVTTTKRVTWTGVPVKRPKGRE